ncbi:hypothetical protein RASY3_13890 [Ruminococcus albus SY3]|uniref:DUF2975 domain-containing protein n=1 Tax=Ruminococcus albus SY3 TaxID=1341156 RepID=A0A011VSP0_RUMAL|nr:DUF2975 domain-containing protein [Ruminococcus albus]EXM37613.1 hypothetical protein RASY3_13890 [Ruminococcus albus SY3]
MNPKISGKLKKRSIINSVVIGLLCFTSLVVAICEFISYINNPQMIELLINGIYTLAIFSELGLLAMILLEIRKTGKPFSKKIITKLRIMGFILFVTGALVPPYYTIPISEHEYCRALNYNTTNILVIGISIIIGLISEVFVYGLKLQQENDLIA